MERVHRTWRARAVGHGPAGGDQGLGGYLTAEHPQPVLGRAETPIQIDLQGLEVEQVEKVVEGGSHLSMMACRLVRPDLI
jgi:hypothetical protein